MDGGVYNRSLFRRRDAAKDGLRQMGGIMSASPELMAAAQEAAPPVQTGQGRVLFQAPSLLGPMSAPQPIPEQAYAPPPPAMEMLGQQPMPEEQAPPQPPVQFQTGGMVELEGAMESMGGAQTFDRPIRPAAAPTAEQPRADVNAVLAQIAEQLSDPAVDPLVQSEAILDAVEDTAAVERTGNTEQDIRTTAANLGVPNAYEARIDQLNRAITGAAIAAGTSPSAAENIANGILTGLQLQREDEIRRSTNLLTAQTAALKGNEQGATWFDTPQGKIAKDYIEKQAGLEKDPETIIEELNALVPGANLGDQFRAAVRSGAVPPGMAAAPVAEEAGSPARPDMNYHVERATSAIERISASGLSPEEKARRIEQVRATFIQNGGNPSLLPTGQ